MIEHEIWPAAGIADLPPDLPNLAVPGVARVRESWQSAQNRADPGALGAFTVQLHREWSIETGIIENLYDIERGVTQALRTS